MASSQTLNSCPLVISPSENDLRNMGSALHYINCDKIPKFGFRIDWNQDWV